MMGIRRYPKPGQVLMCDFSGFNPPEINKIRPVITISPRLKNRPQLVAVVPVSTTPPREDVPFAIRLSKNYHPKADDDVLCWAKCDLVMNISLERLNGFKIGRRKWKYPSLTAEDFHAVRVGVLYGLGMAEKA